MKHNLIVPLILVALVISSCVPVPTPTPVSPSGIPNPASKYCVDQGGKLAIRDEAGGQAGYCLFPDGSECDEWAFFRGECAPGGKTPGVGIPNPASKYCADQGGKLAIRDEAGGQAGYCVFPDGSECDEWAFFRGECVPGGKTPGADMPNPASKYCVDQGGKLEIRDEAGGQAGYCLFPDGSECDEWAFFRGECAPGSKKPGVGRLPIERPRAVAQQPQAMSSTAKMQPVVEKLKDLIEKNGWQAMFEEAIKNAQRYNVPRIKDIKNLDDYLTSLNALLEWIPSETEPGREIYYRICEFYFILDQEPVKGLQNKITPENQAPPLTPLSAWMVEYANAWGAFLDTPESLTRESLQTFYNSPRFNMQEYMPDPGGWKTFNQLFARHVKPGMRPIAALNDDTVIVSAADSTFVGWWQINEDSKVTVKNLQWSVLELLEGSPYRDRFKGGIFTHSFLNTTDYHRLHVPVGGTVLESRVIHGQVYLDVQAVPVAGTDEYRVEGVRELDAQDATGYQFAQSRGLIVLDTSIGLVAVLPIGMAQVSSVVMTAEVGKKLHKGEEFAYFQFGGSDHIVMFEAASMVNLTAQPDVHYNQGAVIGKAYPCCSYP